MAPGRRGLRFSAQGRALLLTPAAGRFRRRSYRMHPTRPAARRGRGAWRCSELRQVESAAAGNGRQRRHTGRPRRRHGAARPRGGSTPVAAAAGGGNLSDTAACRRAARAWRRAPPRPAAHAARRRRRRHGRRGRLAVDGDQRQALAHRLRRTRADDTDKLEAASAAGSVQRRPQPVGDRRRAAASGRLVAAGGTDHQGLRRCRRRPHKQLSPTPARWRPPGPRR